jgi:hypothetical protein
MKKVKLDVLKPWIIKQVIQYMKLEDDVLINMIENLLEVQVLSNSIYIVWIVCPAERVCVFFVAVPRPQADAGAADRFS